ncbi:MAG: DUF1631 family protein, partial [Thiohalobacterales bacterium]|nr:DUF1631 family protein [Thiohalobacterales bacterium]
PAIRKLLGDVWLDKLMFIYLREPEAENSPSWRLAIRTIDDIIWSVEPRFSADSQDELRAKLPMLRKRIAQAFADLNTYGTCDNDMQLKKIAALQDEALRQPVDEQFAALAMPEEARPDTEEHDGRDTGEACTADSGEEAFSPAAQQALERLRDIEFGTWFHIQTNKTSHPARVKLSWFSNMSGNYMFVDSMGVKSTVWNQRELALMLSDGRARIISEDNEPFVKRALIAIRRILTGD